jgi:large subunit ribosomal protein L4
MQLAVTGAQKKITLSDEIFALPLNKSLLAQAVRTQQSNQRSANAHAKTRGEVSGGGKKPWRQKGTGRARVGSSRTPLWRGGGVIFGPTSERSFSLKMPAKMAKKAFHQALSFKAAEKKFFVVSDPTMQNPSTKAFVELLSGWGIDFRSAILVTAKPDRNLQLSARNLDYLATKTAGALSTYDILRADALIFTESALEAVQGKQRAPRAAKAAAQTPTKKTEASQQEAK